MATLDLKPPSFIDENYIKNILMAIEKNPSIKIENLDYKAATGKGNHYASVMVRVSVNYEIGSDSPKKMHRILIIKSSFSEKECNDILETLDIHKREILAYRSVIPELQKLLQQINDDTQLTPKLLFLDDDKHSVMAFEDLCEQDYKNVDRIGRLDWDHAILVMEKLAKFHATSMVLQEKQPEIMTHFSSPLIERNKTDNHSFFMNIFMACIEHVSQLEGYSYYADKLQKIKDHFIEREVEATASNKDDDGFNVLTHGDMWHMNMMFKYKDGDCKPEDVILLDLQLPFWSSPTNDLHYFINTSLSEDVRLQYQNELIQFYYNELVGCLGKFKYEKKIPTLHELRVDMLRRNFHALMSAFICQPIMLLDESIDADLRLLMGDDQDAKDLKKKLFFNSHITVSIKNLLPIFDQMGLLD